MSTQTKPVPTAAPVITLKNVKTFIGREGYGLNATIYVDGIKTAFIMDDASGGEPDYDVFNEEKFDEVKAYCEAQPETPMVIGGEPIFRDDKPLMVKLTLDELVDNAFNIIQRENFKKKLERKMLNHIMWGIPGGKTYKEVKMKANLDQYPTVNLQARIDHFKKEFKLGEQFLNTNLVALKIKL